MNFVKNPIKALEGLKKSLKEFLDDIFGKGAGDTIFSVIEGALDVVMGLFNNFLAIVDLVVSAFETGIGKITELVDKARNFIGIESSADAATVVAVHDGFDAFDNMILEKAKDATYGGANYLQGVAQSLIMTMTSSSIASNSSDINKNVASSINGVEVNIHATDPKGTANLLESELSSAISRFNDGVLA